MTERSFQHALYRSSVAQLQYLLEQAPKDIQRRFSSTVCYHLYAHQTKQEIITWKRVSQLQNPDQDYRSIVCMMDVLVETYPEQVWAYILRARALWGIQYYVAAFQDLHTAIKLDPENYTAKLLFCYTLLFLNKLDEVEVFAKSLRTEFGEQFSTLLMLHFLYEKQGINAKDGEDRTKYFKDALFILSKAKLLYPTQVQKLQEHEERILERLETCGDNS